MTRIAFEARVYLDLDVGLVDTRINLTNPRVVESMWRMHRAGAFGKVSPGRFVVVFHINQHPATQLPLFSKESMEVWVVDSTTYSLLRLGWRGDEEAVDDLLYASFSVHPDENRGPALRMAANKE